MMTRRDNRPLSAQNVIHFCDFPHSLRDITVNPAMYYTTELAIVFFNALTQFARRIGKFCEKVPMNIAISLLSWRETLDSCE